jgi:hypothetical protein
MSGPTTVRICSAILTGGPPPCSPGMLLMVVYLLASRAWRALPPGTPAPGRQVVPHASH